MSHTQKNGKRTIVCRISMTITYFKNDKNDKQNWNLTFFLAILGSVYKILQKKMKMKL